MSLLPRACGWQSWTTIQSNNFSNIQRTSAKMNSHFSALDPTQASLMMESCIAVDTEDRALHSITKKAAHLLGPAQQLPPLHRAFSVFLFNSDNQLLLQQRSASKITFPNYFTNTCCSHPSYTPEELDEDGLVGIKRAAKRRLYAELGVEPTSLQLSDFHVLTRILYGAPSDSQWGEHEIDYIIFLKKDVELKVNPNEVSQVCYVSRDGFQEFLSKVKSENLQLTPWFELIVKHRLMKWWEKIDRIHTIDFDPIIHKFNHTPQRV